MALHTSFLRFLKDEKGQEFSVFKLLISAVIAVVILGLLLSIINSIGLISGAEPQKEAGNTVKAIMRDNATIKASTEVTFDNKNRIINASGISSASGGVLQPNEVCISAGQFTGNTSWVTGEGGSFLEYKGSSAINAVVIAACDNVATINDTYGGDVSESKSSNFGSSIGTDWFNDCACVSDSEAARCCFVAVKRPN